MENKVSRRGSQPRQVKEEMTLYQVTNGDLVEVGMIGSLYYKKIGIVVDKIHYTTMHRRSMSGVTSPVPLDEYSCKIKLLNPEEDSGECIMVRAKWLKVISKAKG